MKGIVPVEVDGHYVYVHTEREVEIIDGREEICCVCNLPCYPKCRPNCGILEAYYE